MYRTTSHLALGLSIAVLITQAAQAQSPDNGQRNQQTPKPAIERRQQTGLKEDFDQDPVTGWEFASQYAFVSTGNGRALATKGAAFWAKAGEVGDFTMKIRYAYERGIALVDFRHARRYGINDRYVLLLHANGVGLIRVQHLPGGVQEKELASAPIFLPPQTWHEVIIQAADEQINVWVDGKGVISVRDVQPLRAGMCALGVESGVVLYDEVILIRQDDPSRGDAHQADLTSDPANWPSWSAASESQLGHEPPSSNDE
jgi:hypothetical protein